MASTYTCTFFFNVPDYGWTETFWVPNQTDISVVLTKCQAVAKKRILLCGGGVSLPAVRISDIALYRDYGLFQLGFSTGSESTAETNHAKPYSAVLVQINAVQYRNRIFLRGLANNDILGDEPLNVQPDRVAGFNGWSNAMIQQGFNIRVQARFAPDLIGGNVIGATNASPIVIQTDAAHGQVTGNPVFIRAVKGNRGANGKFTVDVVDATHFALRGSTGTGLYLSGGVWRQVFYVYKPIQSMTLVREVSRRTGRPSTLSRGRRYRRAISL